MASREYHSGRIRRQHLLCHLWSRYPKQRCFNNSLPINDLTAKSVIVGFSVHFNPPLRPSSSLLSESQSIICSPDWGKLLQFTSTPSKYASIYVGRHCTYPVIFESFYLLYAIDLNRHSSGIGRYCLSDWQSKHLECWLLFHWIHQKRLEHICYSLLRPSAYKDWIRNMCTEKHCSHIPPDLDIDRLIPPWVKWIQQIVQSIRAD